MSDDVSLEPAPMRVLWRLPILEDGSARAQMAPWPATWPLPSVGDEVVAFDDITLIVGNVCWYPGGDDESDEPYVYVILRHLDERDL